MAGEAGRGGRGKELREKEKEKEREREMENEREPKGSYFNGRQMAPPVIHLDMTVWLDS